MKLLESAPKTTRASEEIYDRYEEGLQERKRIELGKPGKRAWLSDADKNNGGERTQRFHLQNQIKCVLQRGHNLDDPFDDRHIKNAALFLYIREIVYGDDVSDAKEKIAAFYQKNPDSINRMKGMHKLL